MKNFVCFLFVFTAACISNLQSLSAEPASNNYRITASEYANFLNTKAVTDAQNLYNEKMISGPEAACIIRSGSPGNYFYQVIEGRKNFPITYVTKHAGEEYCAWLQQQDAYPPNIQENKAPFPTSNQEGLSLLLSQDSLFLSLNKNENSSNTYLSKKNIAIGIGTLVLALGVRNALASRCCEEEIGTQAPLENPHSFNSQENREVSPLPESSTVEERKLDQEDQPSDMTEENFKQAPSHHDLIRFSESSTLTPEKTGNDEEIGSQAPLENQAIRSSEEVEINCDDTLIFFPKMNTFIAGKTLRNELSEGIKQTILSSLNKRKNNVFKALSLDLDRAHFVICDQAGFSQGLYTANTEKEEAIQRFKDFIGIDHPTLAEAIAIIMNQTLFADRLRLLHDTDYKFFIEGEGQKFSSTGLIKYGGDIFLEVANNSVQINYNLKKQPEELLSFILKASSHLDQKISDNESFMLKEDTFFCYQFTINPYFSETEPITLENFPCDITCLYFKHEYNIHTQENENY
ncbi:MAG: hypothetical protein ACH346_06530 [Chthoniobacterales bacterium]